MPRVDAAIRSLFQSVYDVLWDQFALPIGTFRIVVTLVPIISDLGLRLYLGTPDSALLGMIIFFGGVFLFYTPTRVASDNRLQAQGRYIRLNATAHYFMQRTQVLRPFYLALLTFNLIVFHHFQGFALVNVVYARCILVRARQEPQSRSILQPSAA